MDAILEDFVCDVADNRTKIDILHYFNGQASDPICRGPFISSHKLAARVEHGLPEVVRAVVELSESGVVSYVSSFGEIDLCYMDTKRHTPRITQGLAALSKALDSTPQDIDTCLAAVDTHRTGESEL